MAADRALDDPAWIPWDMDVAVCTEARSITLEDLVRSELLMEGLMGVGAWMMELEESGGKEREP